jgi:hypothetical protein
MFQELGFESGYGVVRGSAYKRPADLDDAAAQVAYYIKHVATPAVHYEVAAAVTEDVRLVVMVNGTLANERTILADIAAEILRTMIPDISIGCFTTTTKTVIEDRVFTLFDHSYWVRVELVYDGPNSNSSNGPELVSDFIQKFTTVFREQVTTASTVQVLLAKAHAIVNSVNKPDTPLA